MSKKIDLSRRDFLLKSALLSAGSVAAPFALNLFSMRSAMAASGLTGYKALVCLYLAGGNDHNNTVIATDTAAWPSGATTPTSFDGYTAARGGSIGFTQAALANTAITTPASGKEKTLNTTVARTYALHPSLGKYNANVTGSLKDMYDKGQVAIVPNVGTLIHPISDWRYYRGSGVTAVTHPTNLFSHSDQTNQWVNSYPGTTKANFGWGGRIADLIYSNNTNKQFTSLSLSGNNTFLAGESVNQIQINSNGVPVAITNFNNLFGSVGNYTQTVVSPNTYSTNKFEIEHANVVSNAIAADGLLQQVMTATAPNGSTPVPVPTQYVQPNSAAGALANNSLAVQLQTVARMIAGQSTLGSSRQIFFVSIGGFDTHTTQATNQSDLLARVSHAIDYFYNTALKSSAMPGGDQTNNVTLFTASDFGRTFTSNGSGTDHGWGSHHFVVGGNGVTAGSVKGGDIYGSFPQTFVSSSNVWGDPKNNPLDVGSGNFIPQISVDQYAATLAKWFGLTYGIGSELATVFPNLVNFDPTYFATSDLGFMI